MTSFAFTQALRDREDLVQMHIPPFENQNAPIIDVNDVRVPLNYFNIVKLGRGQVFEYRVPDYETCVVPATGTVDVEVEGTPFNAVGSRGIDVWDGEPEGVYVTQGARTRLVCTCDAAEIFIAGARCAADFAPFAVRGSEIDVVQYGSDDTKTHRKIKHILGSKYRDRVGRLLVSELFTVGAGGWSGFPPHKHDTDRLPIETRHDETYNFRFRPNHGFGLQLVQREDGAVGDAYHLIDGSTVVLDKGYHPCVAAPGYEMYYFTILGGLSQRPLVQFFQPVHAYQVETIPGIKDMIAKFK
jgi:5-deoxy-glucuronate isomerase